jgi:Fe-S-cluster-containing hydrogenase component 2
MKVPIMRASFKRNLLSDNNADIEIVGESIKDVAIANFVIPDTVQYPHSGIGESRLFTKLIESIKPKVAFNYKECKRCKECCNVCPAKAIEFYNGKPRINHRKCIKCFCCHELCTANAVKIKQSSVLKSLLTLGLYNKSLQKSVEKMFGMIAKDRQLNRKKY